MMVWLFKKMLRSIARRKAARIFSRIYPAEKVRPVGEEVTMNGVTYDVTDPFVSAGPCSWNDFGTPKCHYTDEKLPHLDTLRLWADEKGVFALNPIDFSFDHYSLDKLLITKNSRSVYFSASEVAAWRSILAGMQVRKVE
jgi:hypothetical protein